VFFTTYNVLNLFADDSPAAREHYRTIVEVIRSLDTDVLAIQEILAADEPTAARRLRQLADDAGLRCEVSGPGAGHEPALAVGGHGYHVGLMWRDGIEPLPGSLRCRGGSFFWHGLAVVTLDLGGIAIRHGAFHATPFGRALRADQNARTGPGPGRAGTSMSPPTRTRGSTGSPTLSTSASGITTSAGGAGTGRTGGQETCCGPAGCTMPPR
jgi:hypothetical protein